MCTVVFWFEWNPPVIWSSALCFIPCVSYGERLLKQCTLSCRDVLEEKETLVAATHHSLLFLNRRTLDLQDYRDLRGTLYIRMQ